MRNLKQTIFALSVFGALGFPAAAQNYPTQTIKLVVPFGAGGGADSVSRILADPLHKKLGQPVVIENKPGAGGTLGNEAVANAPKDGYTIGIMTAGQIISAVMIKDMRYDTLTAFDPILQLGTASFIIATRPDAPYSNIKELVEFAKKNPDKVVFGSPGFGATQHLAAELFRQTAGIKMLHVPYRSTPETMTALMGKQVDVVFDTVTALLGPVNAGQVKALAVTGKDRFPTVPKLPAAIESGVVPGYDVTSWYGFFGPKGMPTEAVSKLNAALLEVMKEPQVRDRLTASGVLLTGSTPAEFGKFMTDELHKWSKVRVAASLPQR